MSLSADVPTRTVLHRSRADGGPPRPAPAVAAPWLLALLLPANARAAETTTLELTAAASAVRYSQATTVSARLRRADGAGVPASACPAPCSLIVRVAPASDEGGFLLDPRGFVLGPDGDVTVRVPFVDGAFDDARFTATPAGTPWIIRARFAGTGTGALLEPTCEPTAHPEGDLCGAEASVEVLLQSEQATIVLGGGLVGALGDTITLSAAVSDENGNAAPQGDGVDGERAVVLAARTVEFFYDADNNGAPTDAERVGSAATNASGVASVAFTLDPRYVRAGRYGAGIHAQFGGDGQYGVARASAELVVLPGAIDPARSIIEADPRELPANGAAQSVLRVRLVDAFNNPLDENSDAHEVVFATDLGRLLGEVRRDPENGTYTQTLQAQRLPGTATVTTTIDGAAGPSVTIELIGDAGGCQCGGTGRDLPALAALAALALVLRHRSRSARPRGAP